MMLFEDFVSYVKGTVTEYMYEEQKQQVRLVVDCYGLEAFVIGNLNEGHFGAVYAESAFMDYLDSQDLNTVLFLIANDLLGKYEALPDEKLRQRFIGGIKDKTSDNMKYVVEYWDDMCLSSPNKRSVSGKDGLVKVLRYAVNHGQKVTAVYKVMESYEVQKLLDDTACEKAPEYVYMPVLVPKDSPLVEHAVHKPFLDTEIVYRKYDPKKGFGPVLSHYEMIAYGWDESTVYDRALKATMEYLPPMITPMKKVLADLGKPESAEVPCIDWVVHNALKENGASAMLFNDFFKKFADDIGEDIYILPVFDAALMICRKSVGTAKEMKEVVEMSKDSPLNSLYLYERSRNAIRLVN